MVLQLFSDRAYIGDIEAAENVQLLMKKNITAIITCAPLKLPWCSQLGEATEIETCGDKWSALISMTAFHHVVRVQNEILCSFFIDGAALPSPSHTDHYPIQKKDQSLRETTSSSLQHLICDLQDTTDSDLLCHLDQIITFIDNFFSQSKGNLLIHCWAGRSRSASVCTAYLMRQKNKSFAYCLEMLRKNYTNAEPNSGFIRQLISWERMGYQVQGGKTPEHLAYRISRTVRLRGGIKPTTSDIDSVNTKIDVQPSTPTLLPPSVNVETPMKISKHIYETGRSQPNFFTVEDELGNMQSNVSSKPTSYHSTHPVLKPITDAEGQSKVKELMTYNCKICRTVLFDESNVLPCQSTSISSKKNFLRNKRDGGNASPKSQCTSVFIEAMEWMGSTTEQCGKLVCFNSWCRAKLGGYSWYGLRCSCGTWQTPAFQVHLSKVDKLPASLVPAGVKGRMPQPMYID